MVWLDLCSGLGGASQPALDRGWRVWRVDIEHKFRPDIVADIRALALKPFPVDVLWISPPCIEFARLAMPWQRKRYPELIEPDLSIVRAATLLVKQFQPRYWIIENTLHSRRWIAHLFPMAPVVIPGHCFWGKLPCLLPDVKRVPKESLWPSADRTALRALIPYEIGETICRAIERKGNEKGPDQRTNQDCQSETVRRLQ